MCVAVGYTHSIRLVCVSVAYTIYTTFCLPGPWNPWMKSCFVSSSSWPTRDHIGISNPAWHCTEVRCQGLSRPQAPCTPNLHCPIANSVLTQGRKSNQIQPALRCSRSTQEGTWISTTYWPSQHYWASAIVRELVFINWRVAASWNHVNSSSWM